MLFLLLMGHLAVSSAVPGPLLAVPVVVFAVASRRVDRGRRRAVERVADNGLSAAVAVSHVVTVGGGCRRRVLSQRSPVDNRLSLDERAHNVDDSDDDLIVVVGGNA